MKQNCSHSIMTKRFPFSVNWIPHAGLLCLAGAVVATGQNMPVGNADRGEKFFQTSCAICHSTSLGPGNSLIIKQGPTLLGVMGRKAATSPHFNYTQALVGSGLVWNAATLNRFLTDPMKAIP